MCSISERRWNTTSTLKAASAAWWKRRMMAVRRNSGPASASGLVRRQRVACRCSHYRQVTLDRGSQHVPPVPAVVERGGAMLGAAVVPQHRVVQPPAVAVDELGAYREFLQVADQFGAFVIRHALDAASPAADIKRGAA